MMGANKVVGLDNAMPRKEKSPDRNNLPRLKFAIQMERVGSSTIGELGMIPVAVKASRRPPWNGANRNPKREGTTLGAEAASRAWSVRGAA